MDVCLRKIVFASFCLFFVNSVECLSDKYELRNYWNIFNYEINGVKYTSDANYENKVGTFTFDDDVLEEHEKFLIQKNLVPYDMIYLFTYTLISIPRTRPGIPFSLNIVHSYSYDHDNDGPPLSPYPSEKESKNIVSVYDMERDGCRRIWMVDTGFIDIPGVRKQVQEPTVLVINQRYKVILVKAKIGRELLKDGVTSGLRTIALDYVYPCSETFMYINDDHSNAVIVFSLKDLSFRRIERPNTRDEAWTFPVPKSIVNYMKHVPRYRNLPNETFVQYSKYLETTIADREKLRSDANIYGNSNPRGILYERTAEGDVVVFTNEERTHLYCWNVDTPMTEDNIELLATVPNNEFYFADLDTGGNSFHIILNRLRGLNENIYDSQKTNFLYYKTYFSDILPNTKCSMRTECTDFLNNWTSKHSAYGLGDPKYIVKYITDEHKNIWENNRKAIWDQL